MTTTNKTRRGDETGEWAQDTMDEVKDKVSDIVEEAKGRGQEFLGRARERGSELLEEAQGRGETALKNAESWIRKNPGAAVGCAFIAGAIMYALFSRED